MTFAARPNNAPFKPVTRTYTSGSGTETVPSGARQVVITAQASGAVGFVNTGANAGYGGGAGSQAVKTIAVVGSQTLAWALGAPSTSGTSAAADTTVSGTVSGGTVNITAQGGRGPVGGGTSTATGGDTNFTGPAGDQAIIGVANGGVSHDGTFGNGGSANGFAPPGNPGVTGKLVFAYT